MQLEHSFTVPVGPDEAFAVLRDIERIAPCMPGATLESTDGDTFSGRVKVKVGPIQVTYTGTARFVEVDDAAHRAVIEASGKEARGAGTARATITAQLTGSNGQTDVHVTTDLAITGKPAQFGRGVMVDVGEKLIGKFANCLAEELAEQPAPQAAAPATPVPDEAGGTRPSPEPEAAPAAGARQGARPPGQRRTDEVIDLLDVAGASVAKRGAPALVGALVVLLIVWLVRRRG